MKLKSKYYISILLLLIVSVNKAKAQSSPRNWDLYGTTQISLHQIELKLGSEMKGIMSAYESNNKPVLDSLKKVVINTIYKMGDFAYVAISPIKYFSEGKPVFITIDIVDAVDKEKRMPFLKAPGKTFSDPDSLIYYWAKYEEVGMPYMQNNKIDFSIPCPAFHCSFGFSLPELKPFEQRFSNGVALHKEKLVAILKGDKMPSNRGAAAYLLAHIKNGEELVKILLPSIYDNSSLVRNNVMRVLSEIGMKHPEINIPLDLILQAVNFPNVTDRNKSLAILYSLAKRPEHKKKIIQQVGNILIELLKLKQINNQEYAWAILQELAGKDFGERNYDAWNNWVKEYAK